jgi:hypothetical protein
MGIFGGLDLARRREFRGRGRVGREFSQRVIGRWLLVGHAILVGFDVNIAIFIDQRNLDSRKTQQEQHKKRKDFVRIQEILQDREFFQSSGHWITVSTTKPHVLTPAPVSPH